MDIIIGQNRRTIVMGKLSKPKTKWQRNTDFVKMDEHEEIKEEGEKQFWEKIERQKEQRFTLVRAYQIIGMVEATIQVEQLVTFHRSQRQCISYNSIPYKKVWRTKQFTIHLGYIKEYLAIQS